MSAEVTDEDFLSILDNDPWLYAAATQEVEESEEEAKSVPAENDVPEKKPWSPQLSTEEPLSTSANIAAQGRRRELVSRIDAALKRWKPTLTETVPDEIEVSGKGSSGDETSISLESVDQFRRKNETEQEVIGRFLNREGLTSEAPAGPQGASLDRYQLEAINAARAGHSFFLTGSAGTGKSYVLKMIIDELRRQGRTVAVTASTGCAAVGIRGCTVHSLTGIGLGMDPIDMLIRKAGSNRHTRARLGELDTLIIDEISMIDSFLFDKIEAVISAARAPVMTAQRFDRETRKRRRRIGEPFGGVQVIVCGDFYQLPPVGASDRQHQKSSEKYFAFDAAAWKKTIKRAFVLRMVHRQDDRKFVGLLNEVRQGMVSDYTKAVLASCLIGLGKNIEVDKDGNMVHFTKLFAYRRQVSSENQTQLQRLKVQGVAYVCYDIINRTSMGSLTERIVQQMLENTNAPQQTELRKGARVLCLKNLDAEKGIVNGSGGVLVGWSRSLLTIAQKKKADAAAIGLKDLVAAPSPYQLDKEDIFDLDSPKLERTLESVGMTKPRNGSIVLHGSKLSAVVPVVRFDNGVVRLMEPVDWEVHGMRGQVVGIRKQTPLMLGWALSIHRAQGMTLGEVETDVARAFDFGQVYVALSRATSIQGLRLRSFDASKVVTNAKVKTFYKSLESQALKAISEPH